MADLGYISAAEARGGARHSGLGLDVSEGFFEHRQPYFFDYVEDKLIEALRGQHGAPGRARGLHDDRPAAAGGRPGSDALGAPLLDRPLLGAGLDRPAQRRDPRRWSPAPATTRSQFNLAAQGHRQPGSTFKTFVLTTALKQGIDPYSTYYISKPLDLDLPKWGHWEVHTADEGYLGTVNLQQATVASDNTVFAQLDLDVGPERVAETAHSMGITSPLDGIPAEGIGGLRIGVSPLEMADAYATLAAGGIRHDPVAIRRVVFPGGRVERPEQAAPRRVVSEAVAYEVTRLLHDNITEGTGTAAYTGCEGQAGKTGTTDRLTDAWFAGYQPNLSTVVWVGYPESNAIEMTSVHGITVFGGTFPAEIWHSLYSGRRSPLRDIQQAGDADQLGAVLRPASPPRAPGRRLASPTPRGGKRRRRCRGRKWSAAMTPNAYAPGVGQEPYAPPSAAAARRPAGGDAGVGGAAPAERREAASAEPRAGAAFALIWVGFLAYLGVARAGAAARRAGSVWGAIVAARRRLRLPAAAALPRRLQLRRLRPPRASCTASTPTSTRPRRPPPTRPSPTSTGPKRPAPTARSSPSATYPLAWLPVGAAVYVLKAVSAAAVAGARACSSPASPRPAASTRCAPPPSSPSTRSSSSTSSAAPTTTPSRSCR